MGFEETNIEIRMAAVGEAAEIAGLLYSAFIEYIPLYTQQAFAATTLSAEEISERINKRAVWVALCQNRIVGTVSIFFKEHGLYIRSMAVSPPARKKGVGRALLEQVDEVALENRSVYIILNTTPFLLQAIRLYEEVGFKRKGAGELYGTPLIKMIKKPGLVNKNKIVKNDYAN